MLNKIIHGDCLEVMKDIPDKSVDLVVCDLPYGVTQNKKDIIIDLESLWKQYNRIVKDDGVLVFTAQFPFTIDLILSQRKMFRYDLIWNKIMSSGFLNAKRMPLRSHEHILVFYKKLGTYNPQYIKGNSLHSQGNTDKVKTNNNYGNFYRYNDSRAGSTHKYPKSILDISKIHSSVSIHRTEKPVALAEWLIRTYSNEGDVVLDNCIGAGWTALAALKNNRKFIGIEIDEEYVKIARRRIAEWLEK